MNMNIKADKLVFDLETWATDLALNNSLDDSHCPTIYIVMKDNHGRTIGEKMFIMNIQSEATTFEDFKEYGMEVNNIIC